MRCHNHIEGSKKTNCELRVTWINVSSNGHLSRAITCFMSSSQLLVSILKHCETFLYHQTAWFRHHFSKVLSLYELLGFV